MSITEKEEDRVLNQLVTVLLERGSAEEHVQNLVLPPARWRHVARAAGRKIGRSVRTYELAGTVVIAQLPDWPATPEEQARAEQHQEELFESLRHVLPDPRKSRLKIVEAPTGVEPV